MGRQVDSFNQFSLKKMGKVDESGTFFQERCLKKVHKPTTTFRTPSSYGSGNHDHHEQGSYHQHSDRDAPSTLTIKHPPPSSTALSRIKLQFLGSLINQDISRPILIICTSRDYTTPAVMVAGKGGSLSESLRHCGR